MAQVIDMRLRPPFLHRFFGAETGTDEFALVEWVNRRVGARPGDAFSSYRDVADVVGGMDRAGIGLGVVVGRSTPTVRVSNDAVAGLVGEAKGRLVGVGSVDPQALGRDGAVEEARRAVDVLGLVGINLDAGFYKTAVRADDESLMPVYEACLALGVPAFVMSGPTTPDLAFNDPLAIDRVAGVFPGLRIVVCHGCYPRIDEMIGVAFRRENVFISPDMYVFAPGGGRYVEAARGFLGDQLVFGSSFPFRPMAQSVADFRAFGLPAEIEAKVMGGNATRALARESATAG